VNQKAFLYLTAQMHFDYILITYNVKLYFDRTATNILQL